MPHVLKSLQINEEPASARLYQNAPNPFDKSTIIRYSIPAETKKAKISITAIDGSKSLEFDLMSSGGQSVEISGGRLSPGTYVYSLIIDDKLVDSKKMMLTR